MFKQEGYELMGAAFEVYNVLGFGMADEVYQQSLEFELGLRNIPFVSRGALRVSYKNHVLKTVYRPDLLVHDEIVVELRAAKTIDSEHKAQLFNYMRVSEKKVGYLINYGTTKDLQWQRFVLT